MFVSGTTATGGNIPINGNNTIHGILTAPNFNGTISNGTSTGIFISNTKGNATPKLYLYSA